MTAVSVVIPTYNEAENIAGIVEAVTRALSDREHELLVVDDGSPDGTADIVQDLQDGYPQLRLLQREEQAGIGSAYREAFTAVEGDIVVQMDADFSHPPEQVPDLVAAVEQGSDVAVGSRYVEGGDRKDPIHRRIFPLIGSYLYRVLLRSPVQDVTSGFKAYRRELAEDIAAADLPDGFNFQAESLFTLLDDGASVTEVPIDFRPRRGGEPKYSYTTDLPSNVVSLLKLAGRKHHRMLKFGLIGASGVGVNMGLLYLLTEYIGLYYLYSAVIAIETSIISNFVLNDLWTFYDRGESGGRAVIGRFTKFHLVSLVGMGINLGLLWVFTEIFGIHYLLSNLFAIGIVFLWNYGANILWTWQEEI